MDDKALADGIAAFKQGMMRVANPCDPSTEEWMGWRDGSEQAKAVAERPTSIDDLRTAADALKFA